MSVCHRCADHLSFLEISLLLVFLFRHRERLGVEPKFHLIAFSARMRFSSDCCDRRRPLALLDDKINKIREFRLAVGCAILRKKLVRSHYSRSDTIIAPLTKVKARQQRVFSLPTLYLGAPLSDNTTFGCLSYMLALNFFTRTHKKYICEWRAELFHVRLRLFSLLSISLINFNKMLRHCAPDSSYIFFNKWKHSHMAGLIK